MTNLGEVNMYVRTNWLSLLAAPKPVGPAPIIRTSVFLFEINISIREENSGQTRQVGASANEMNSHLRHLEGGVE